MANDSKNTSTIQASPLPLPQDNPSLRKFLQQRRSNLAKLMTEPGPDETQISHILDIAARVPDHRKLTPWRFICFAGDTRKKFGTYIATAFTRDNPDLPVDRAVFESQRLMRAPLVIAVISSPKTCPRGTPKWEQKLSAGAVCFNLCLAAQSYGFGAQWLTEWYSYHDDVNQALGLDKDEVVAGYIYIGTVTTPPVERARPDVKTLIHNWQ